MTKKMIVENDVAMFEMKVRGGNLPQDFEANIAVEIDFAAADKTQLIEIAASGQSARVALQAQLRKKSVQELMALGENGLRISVQDIYAGQIVRPVDRLMALSRADFVATMVRDLGLEEAQANEIYNRKHGIASGDEAEDEISDDEIC